MRALIVLAIVVAPVVALAQPSSDIKARAKVHVSAGLAAQQDGRYDEAIAEYQAGYALVPHPEILFNLAQAHRLKGDAPRALAYYRRYLAIDPRGRVAPDAERWVRELEPVVGDDEVDLARDAGAAADDDVATQPPKRARPGRTLRIAGLATAAAGGISLAAGIKFGLDARDISDELSANDGPWTDALLARQADGRSAETRMFIFTGVGAAAVIGGVAMYVVGSRATVAPVAGDGVVGLAVAGEL
jgi:tetratricopeptide (TPR) repeat protein